MPTFVFAGELPSWRCDDCHMSIRRPLDVGPMPALGDKLDMACPVCNARRQREEWQSRWKAENENLDRVVAGTAAEKFKHERDEAVARAEAAEAAIEYRKRERDEALTRAREAEDAIGYVSECRGGPEILREWKGIGWIRRDDLRQELKETAAQCDVLAAALEALLEDRDAACICDEDESRCRYHASDRAARAALNR